jgi:two-component system chemotaxis response regulator CheB
MNVARSRFEIVVLASSAGGVDALSRVLAPLPNRLGVPIVIVQHLGRDGPSYLTQILNDLASMPVDWAHAGDRVMPGRIYVAPPMRHLLLSATRRCVLSNAEPIHYSRPAADPLFQSAAAAYGARVLAVVLTGRLQDAAAGATTIKRAGGVVIAQSPESCVEPSMPRAAIDSGSVDHIVDLDAIASAIVSLVVVPSAPTRSVLSGSRPLDR